MIGYAWHRITKSRRVIVNLKSGGAIQGDLVRTAGNLLELRNAELVEDPSATASPVKVDGSAIISVDNVAFAQALD